MEKVYADLIEKGVIVIDDVPVSIVGAVAAELDRRKSERDQQSHL